MKKTRGGWWSESIWCVGWHCYLTTYEGCKRLWGSRHAMNSFTFFFSPHHSSYSGKQIVMIPAEFQRRDVLQKGVSNLRYELERTQKKSKGREKTRHICSGDPF